MKSYLLLLLYLSLPSTSCLSLTSRTTIRGRPVCEVRDFLATPTNWPSIVASSFGVEPAEPLSPGGKTNDVDRPLRKGERVTEIFGLPPLLPLTVTWTCVANDDTATTRRRGSSSSSLAFASTDGLAGIAENCRMVFDVVDDGGGDTAVELTMEFDPVSPLANLAAPVLKLDNEFAVGTLLPLAMRKSV